MTRRSAIGVEKGPPSSAAEAALGYLVEELRTQMRLIKGASELLLEGEGEESRRGLLLALHRSAESLSELAADLLEPVPSESVPPASTRVAFELDALLERECEALRPSAEQRGVTLELSLPSSLPKRMLGDAVRLRQALAHALRFALRIAKSGALRVGAAVLVSDDRVSLTVSVEMDECRLDQGAFERLDRIRDERGAPLRSHEFGFGLAKRAAESMGGRLESRGVLSGARFELEVVLGRAAPDSGTAPSVLERRPSIEIPPSSVRSREDDVVDFARLNEVGSADLVRELTVIFVEDMTARLDALGSARTAANRAVFERCAHAVKGACGNFGARRMATLAERIEHSPNPTDDLTALLLAELRTEFDRVRAALRSRNLPA